MFAYSGLGCRNVSLLFLPGGCEPMLAPPPMSPKYHNNYMQQRALLTLQGRSFRDCGGALLLPMRDFPPALSCIAYSHYERADEVSAWLEEHDSEVQCVVSDCLQHSRQVPFGRAQSPRIDRLSRRPGRDGVSGRTRIITDKAGEGYDLLYNTGNTTGQERG